ncbi:MAG: TonB-dependent receptor, partial [Verrucomicrobia bacterium]
QGPSPTQPAAPGVIPIHPENKLYGETYGAEAAATFEVTRWWRLQPAYTYLQMQLHKRPGSTDTTSELDEGKSPHHQFSLRSAMDLPHDLSLEGTVRYVDSLPALGIGSYLELNVRLGWRPTKNLELAIVGQNLLDSRHPEFSPSFINTQRTEVERGVYGKLSWKF